MKFPLIEAFDTICKNNPESIAFDFITRKYTYGELNRSINEKINLIKGLGVKSRHRIILAVTDPYDFYSLWYALWKINAVIIPMDPAVKPFEIANAVKGSHADWLIADNRDKYGELETGCYCIKKEIADCFYLHLETGDRKPMPGETALCFFTSGTLGESKCVMFNHDAFYKNIFNLNRMISLTHEDILLTPLSPMLPAAIATAAIPVLSAGATLIYIRHAIPGKIIKTISEKSVRVFYAVPYLYELISIAMSLRKKDAWKSVRLCLSSSAFLKKQLFDDFYKQTGLPIHSIYCSSEAGACTFNNTNAITLLQASVGKPFPGVELEIRDDAGSHLPAGVEGEIVIKGAHVASGYYLKKELQDKVFRDGWVRTGDLGKVDDQGFLYLTGRCSETINISGHLVNPREIEKIILQYPGVKNVFVYGKKDSQLGEVVAAKIVPAEENNLNEGAVIDYCSQFLSSYKIPRRIDFVSELSTSRYGKIARTVNKTT